MPLQIRQGNALTAMYVRPHTVEEACEALAAGSSQILSGGTDFFPALGDSRPRGNIVDLSALKALDHIEVTDRHVRIGGRVTWTGLLRADLPPCFETLRLAAREVGSVQIQNMGTVTGNLCNASPAADGVPPLLALDAEVELTSSNGTRRLVLADFITGNRQTARRPDELLTSIIVPRMADDARSTFLKLGSRRYLVIAIAMVAIVMRVDNEGRIADIRIAIGACSAVAIRLTALEQALIGVAAQHGVGALAHVDHLTSLSPIDDSRATAAYRRDAGLTLIRRALDDCAGGTRHAR